MFSNCYKYKTWVKVRFRYTNAGFNTGTDDTSQRRGTLTGFGRIHKILPQLLLRSRIKVLINSNYVEG